MSITIKCYKKGPKPSKLEKEIQNSRKEKNKQKKSCGLLEWMGDEIL